MFDFSIRGRLIRRGLASRKTRRRRARSELKRNLEYSPYTKVVIFAVFVGGLAFLVFSGQQPEPTKTSAASTRKSVVLLPVRKSRSPPTLPAQPRGQHG